MDKLFYKENAGEENRSFGSVKEDAQSITESFYNIHIQRVSRLKELIKIPRENECTFIWSLNSFNAFTFIPFCIAKFGQIEELYLSTYSINLRIINALIKEIDNKNVLKAHIFISESIKIRQYQLIEHLESQVNNRENITVSYGWNHSKVTCAKCKENYLIFEGSGNWSENSRYEQYVLVNSKTVFYFRKNIITNE